MNYRKMPNLPLLKYKYNIAAASAVAIFFLIDRILKSIVLSIYPKDIDLIGKLISFKLITNKNIAFSLPIGGPWLMWVILIIILIILGRAWVTSRHKSNLLEQVGLWLMATGAISNFIDRWKYGHVIDYISWTHFSVFNLADIMITAGALVLFFIILKKQ